MDGGIVGAGVLRMWVWVVVGEFWCLQHVGEDSAQRGGEDHCLFHGSAFIHELTPQLGISGVVSFFLFFFFFSSHSLVTEGSTAHLGVSNIFLSSGLLSKTRRDYMTT